MPWVPIAESGVQFELFTARPDIVSLVGSVATSTASAPDDFSGFDIQFGAPAPRLRISAVGPYQIYSEFSVSYPAQFNYGEHEQINESVDFDLEWLPTQFEFDVPETSETLMYTPASGSEWTVSDSYQFLIEVWQEGPEPPSPAGKPYLIRGTHRAYMSADTDMTAWVRTETGKLDLTAYETLEVDVMAYGRPKPRTTLTATGTDEGLLSFTVTAEGARKRLWPGTFNLFAKGDGQVIYTGLLEVLE